MRGRLKLTNQGNNDIDNDTGLHGLPGGFPEPVNFEIVGEISKIRSYEFNNIDYSHSNEHYFYHISGDLPVIFVSPRGCPAANEIEQEYTSSICAYLAQALKCHAFILKNLTEENTEHRESRFVRSLIHAISSNRIKVAVIVKASDGNNAVVKYERDEDKNFGSIRENFSRMLQNFTHYLKQASGTLWSKKTLLYGSSVAAVVEVTLPQNAIIVERKHDAARTKGEPGENYPYRGLLDNKLLNDLVESFRIIVSNTAQLQYSPHAEEFQRFRAQIVRDASDIKNYLGDKGCYIHALQNEIELHKPFYEQSGTASNETSYWWQRADIKRIKNELDIIKKEHYNAAEKIGTLCQTADYLARYEIDGTKIEQLKVYAKDLFKVIDYAEQLAKAIDDIDAELAKILADIESGNIEQVREDTKKVTHLQLREHFTRLQSYLNLMKLKLVGDEKISGICRKIAELYKDNTEHDEKINEKNEKI